MDGPAEVFGGEAEHCRVGERRELSHRRGDAGGEKGEPDEDEEGRGERQPCARAAQRARAADARDGEQARAKQRPARDMPSAETVHPRAVVQGGDRVSPRRVIGWDATRPQGPRRCRARPRMRKAGLPRRGGRC